MRQRNKFLTMLFVGLTMLAWSCKKDKDEPKPESQPQKEEQQEENTPELITTVRLKFTNQNDLNDVTTVAWKDLDGNGGNPAEKDSLKLKSGVIYNMETEFLDEVNNKDVTIEIKTESDDHQVFYEVIPEMNLMDVNLIDNNPGLVGTVTVVGPVDNTGILRVVLKHQPGTKDGNINTGTTDISAEFPIKIIAP